MLPLPLHNSSSIHSSNRSSILLRPHEDPPSVGLPSDQLLPDCLGRDLAHLAPVAHHGDLARGVQPLGGGVKHQAGGLGLKRLLFFSNKVFLYILIWK